MAPNVEIVKFVASPAYIADHSVANAAFDEVSKVAGSIALHHGSEIQEPEYAYLINVWQNLEAHEKFANDQDYFKRVIAGFDPMLAPEGIKYIRDVTFNTEDPHVALGAPVTEFAFWTLKSGADSRTFQEKLDKLVKLANSWGTAKGVYPGGWGQVAQDDKQFCVLLGWDNLEIFQQAVGGSPEALGLIGELKELADLDLKHTVIKKH